METNREKHQPVFTPWDWRRLHCAGHMRYYSGTMRYYDERLRDTGYCLDRYSIDKPDGTPVRSAP